MEQENQLPEKDTSASISLNDLVLLYNLVRITAERGAIKADEMGAVGTVYDRLGKFLQSSGAFTQPTSPEAPSNQSSGE